MLTVSVDDRATIDEIIAQNHLCHVAMIDEEGMPYVIPMNFGYEDDIIYMHSALEGRSIEALRKNPNVCITFCSESELVYQNVQVACSYRMRARSVMCRGKVAFEENFDEKVKALNIIMKNYTDRAFTYSEPAVRNVLIWKVEVESISTRVYGVPHSNSRKHKDMPLS